ncbi:MAG: hypothetical protein M1543_04250 [Firmicutes bacterium]|nr:hypothetical protein [Bacillota bacterium]
MVLEEIAPGKSLDQLKEITPARYEIAAGLREMAGNPLLPRNLFVAARRGTAMALITVNGR